MSVSLRDEKRRTAVFVSARASRWTRAEGTHDSRGAIGRGKDDIRVALVTRRHSAPHGPPPGALRCAGRARGARPQTLANLRVIDAVKAALVESEAARAAHHHHRADEAVVA